MMVTIPPQKNGDIRDGFLMFVIGFTVDESWKDVADRPGNRPLRWDADTDLSEGSSIRMGLESHWMELAGWVLLGNGFEKGGFASGTWRFEWGADDSSRIHGRVIPIEQIAFLIGTCGKHVGWNEVSCFQTKPTCHGSHLRRLVLVEMPHYTKWPFQWMGKNDENPLALGVPYLQKKLTVWDWYVHKYR